MISPTWYASILLMAQDGDLAPLMETVRAIGKEQIDYRDSVMLGMIRPCGVVLFFIIGCAVDATAFPLVPTTAGGFFSTFNVLSFLPILLLFGGAILQKFERVVPPHSRFIAIFFAFMILCLALVVDQFIARLVSLSLFFTNGFVSGTSTLLRSGGALLSAIGIAFALIPLIMATIPQWKLVAAMRDARRRRMPSASGSGSSIF